MTDMTLLLLSFFFRFDRVPLGFVCGYPLSGRTGGELYGGSMFARSAAMDTSQGKAIQAVNELWGDHDKANWSAGRESIGIPVCKKKYRPFLFRLETGTTVGLASGVCEPTSETENADANSTTPFAAAAAATAASDSGKKSAASNQVRVVVERMYGCKCHHEQRKRMIEQHGLRKGWEPFGQWSMRKAQEMAKREEKRIQEERINNLDQDGEESDLEEVSSSDEASQNFCSMINTNTAVASIGPPLTLHGGRSCTAGSSLLWKVKSAHDDIYKEIHGFSEAEDNNDL
jgi:hypothetical protein